ncbi:hypothetical protein EV2_019686 [Malus domestica]
MFVIEPRPIKQQFPILSYTDFYQWASVVAVEIISGPDVPFYPRKKEPYHSTLTPGHYSIPFSAAEA